jgi:hypothetical protein
MIKDLILIGCIIVASFIFKLSNTAKKNNSILFDPQMMFILLTLAIVVIHKVFYMRNMHQQFLTPQKEGFQSNSSDLASELLAFTSGQNAGGVSEQVTSMSETARREYLAKMDDLNNNITTLNALFREQSDNPLAGGDDSNTNSRMSAENMQKMQNFQIGFLQKQIEKSKQLLQQQEIEENAKKYKPIKVYSSCAVSSADGAFTEDTFEDTQANHQNTTDNSERSNDSSNTSTTIRRAVGQQSGNNNQLGELVSGFLNNLSENSQVEIY